MKKKGSVCDYTSQRSEDLYDVYKTITDSTNYILLPDIAQQCVRQKAPRFYVSEERAALVIAAMEKGKDIQGMTESKLRMYREIHRRVRRIKKQRPGITHNDAVTIVVNQPAPEFYITPGTAIVLLHRVRKARRSRRTRSHSS
jgi:hypothetical protein